MEANLDKRYQTLLVLWGAQLMSIGMFFLVTLLVAPELSNESGSVPGRSILIVVLTALGTVLVIVSFSVKSKILERAVERQDVNLVQKALVIACAMCEVSALLGLIDRFVIGDSSSYYLLFLLAAGGIAFHFPRRSQVEAASYKTPGLT